MGDSAPAGLPGFCQLFFFYIEVQSIECLHVESADIAQNRGDWRRRVNQPPFAIGKLFVRRPRGDTTRTPEQRREDEARRAAETAERQANSDAASHAHHSTYS